MKMKNGKMELRIYVSKPTHKDMRKLKKKWDMRWGSLMEKLLKIRIKYNKMKPKYKKLKLELKKLKLELKKLQKEVKK